MLCNMKIETEYICCGLGRKTYVCYALLKVIIDTILAGCLLYAVPWLPSFAATVYCCMAFFFGVDIILQGMLVGAVYKYTEKNVRAYKNYTKVLWWKSLIMGVIYLICYFDIVPNDLARYFFGLEDIFATYIAVIFVSAVIQWIILNNLMKPNTDKPKKRVLKFNFRVQSELVRIDKEDVETERIDKNAVEEIVIMNEKANLTK